MSANANFTLPQSTLHAISEEVLQSLIQTAVTQIEGKVQPQYNERMRHLERQLLPTFDDDQMGLFEALDAIAIEQANHAARASFHMGLLLGLGILPLSHVRGEKAEFAS